MKTIELTQNQVALVDDEDFEWLNQWKWRAVWDSGTHSFYAMRTAPRVEGKRSLGMHRLILGLGPGEMGDHEDHDTLNNQRYNLRRCTNAQNQANGRKRRDNTSGSRGVHWRKAVHKWVVQIKVSGRFIHLGYFDDITAAARAYDAAARQHFGEFACCNFQEGEDCHERTD